MSTELKYSVQRTAQTLLQQVDHYQDKVGDAEQYYTGKGNVAQRLAITLGTTIHDRVEKLAFVGWVFDRPIRSTKDLYVGEAIALSRYEAELQELHREYLQEFAGLRQLA